MPLKASVLEVVAKVYNILHGMVCINKLKILEEDELGC